MSWKKILMEGDAAVLSDTAPTNPDFSAATAGAASDASRRDHKHQLSAGVVGDMAAIDGGAAALGSATGVSHVDHKHALGPLSANFNFNQKQAVGLIAHAAAAAPNAGAEVEGQLYYNSTGGDKHLYVWVP